MCLNKRIEVYSADAPVVIMGAAFGGGRGSGDGGDRDVLRLSYHAHFFALGAHYNSIVKRQK